MIIFKILLVILCAAPVIGFAFFLFCQVERSVNKTNRREREQQKKSKNGRKSR